jgi:hypothetical protein
MFRRSSVRPSVAERRRGNRRAPAFPAQPALSREIRDSLEALRNLSDVTERGARPRLGDLGHGFSW